METWAVVKIGDKKISDWPNKSLPRRRYRDKDRAVSAAIRAISKALNSDESLDEMENILGMCPKVIHYTIEVTNGIERDRIPLRALWNKENLWYNITGMWS